MIPYLMPNVDSDTIVIHLEDVHQSWLLQWVRCEDARQKPKQTGETVEADILIESFGIGKHQHYTKVNYSGTILLSTLKNIFFLPRINVERKKNAYII